MTLPRFLSVILVLLICMVGQAAGSDTALRESLRFQGDDQEAGFPTEWAYQNERAQPSTWGAFFRSLAVPGWGHHYVDSDNWGMGKIHLAADVVMLTAWLGIYRQAYVVDKNMYSFAQQHSGVDLKQYDRAYELAVGRHRSYDDYIDYLERTRNWDVLQSFPEGKDYHWHWESEDVRRDYIDMRDRRDNLEKQLPTLAAMMVVNRLVSALSSFSRARTGRHAGAALSVEPGPDLQGAQANISIRF